MVSHDNNEELVDFEEEQDVIGTGANGSTGMIDADDKEKKNFSGIHSTGFRLFARTIFGKIPSEWWFFRDFLLKAELLRAISDLGFEHHSEGE